MSLVVVHSHSRGVHTTSSSCSRRKPSFRHGGASFRLTKRQWQTCQTPSVLFLFFAPPPSLEWKRKRTSPLHRADVIRLWVLNLNFRVISESCLKNAHFELTRGVVLFLTRSSFPSLSTTRQRGLSCNLVSHLVNKSKLLANKTKGKLWWWTWARELVLVGCLLYYWRLVLFIQAAFTLYIVEVVFYTVSSPDDY